MHDYPGIFLDSIIAALDIHVGEEGGILVSDMMYSDAKLANHWPVVPSSSGQLLPRIDWVRAYKRRMYSERYGRFVLHDEQTDRNLAAIKMGVTKRGDRVSITHMSRDMSDGRLSGKFAQIAITSLLLSKEKFKENSGIQPIVAILNPFSDALPHYNATAHAMGLHTELHVAGGASLLYITTNKVS